MKIAIGIILGAILSWLYRLLGAHIAAYLFEKDFRYPFKWWWHKIWCELSYEIWGAGRGYYRHLNRLCETGYNLYGDWMGAENTPRYRLDGGESFQRFLREMFVKKKD